MDRTRNPVAPNFYYTGKDGKKDMTGATVGGGLGDMTSLKAESLWTCRLCVRSEKDMAAMSASGGVGGQGCEGAIPRLLQLCDRFPMKHAFAAFGRELVV